MSEQPNAIPLAKMSDINAHTIGPWNVGAQNDALYVTAGRAPAADNDHPWHDAPRVAVAKVFETTEGECLPLHAMANARLIAAAPDLLAALQDAVDSTDMDHLRSRWAAVIARATTP